MVGRGARGIVGLGRSCKVLFLSRINGPCVMSLELPPRVKSGVFFLFLCLSGGLSSSFLAVFFISILKWGTLDCIAQGPII